MVTGQQFVKKIGSFGSFVFLLLFVLFFIICFSSGKDPIPGYESPHEASYYFQNEHTLSELKTELETNVFPHLTGIRDCRVSDGKLVITIESSSFASNRSAILRYYEESLFEFVHA